MLKKCLSELTQKEFHQWNKIVGGMSLKTYAENNKLNYSYVKRKWFNIKKKLHISGRDWQQHVDYKQTI
jgi:DNA-binding CsgD family transcriptional regulator